MNKDLDEDMVCCPYNRYHVVSKLRIQKHIIKCQKNNPNIKLATCFYNYTHRLKPEEMLKHYEICSHKTRVDGSRYYEHGSYSPNNSSVKSDDHSFNFPKTHVRTQKHFCNPSRFPSKTDSNYRNFKSLNFESGIEGSIFNTNKENLEAEFYGNGNGSSKDGNEDDDDENDDDDDDDDDDDLKPLPLPKTVSKAFTCIKEQTRRYSTKTSTFGTPVVGFGRAKSSLGFSPPRLPRKIDHLLPDVNDLKIISRSEITSCNASVASCKFDDTTTLNSEDIIFDDDDDDDNDDVDNDDDYDEHDKIGRSGVNAYNVTKNEFLFQNFDDYVKIND